MCDLLCHVQCVDGCYLGHYAQWFFWLFFVLGFFIFTTAIVMMVGRWCNWF
jgi:hypothetical protein